MIYTNTAVFTPPAGGGDAQPLLDQVGVGAIAALGFTKLTDSYSGNCIQVRNVNSGLTQDIGFDANGVLDTAAIASHCGIYDGTISIWYDQSGNGYDFNTTNTPQAGGTAQEPFIYYSQAVTTDAQGNIAAYSIEPGSSSTTGARFLNSPAMLARYAPTVSLFGQVNTYNGIGIITTELDNGYNFGTYETGGDKLRVIQSSGAAIVNKTPVQDDGTDSFASTIYYGRNEGSNVSKWWFTSKLAGAPFLDSFTISSGAFNAPTYDNSSIFRYYAGVLYQNCAISNYIYWDLPSGTTLTDQNIYDLYSWVETNLGYTNLATAP